jgi:hypothetical protein
MPLPDSEHSDDANHTPERIALAEAERAELWRLVIQCAASEQERIALLESFVYLLPPRAIQERHPDLFADTRAVYRAKCTLLERLRRATSFQITPRSHSDRYPG